MPSVACPCGHRIQYGEVPCPHEWLAISDVAYDKRQGRIDAEDLYLEMTHFLKCEACGRLAMFWEGFSKPPVFYAPEGPSR
ncbi:MAG: hypothetical protein QM608_06790 [Caulobacter sp.]